MASAIFNKLRRRQSSSLPLRTQHAHSYVHHSSTPPDWPTQPAQATPDVYITSPPEDDGLLTSVCVHRAVEHEPKRLRKHEDPALSAALASAPVAASTNPDANPADVEGPPTFRRPSLQAPDVVLPKKPSELNRESAAKWAHILGRQPPSETETAAQEQVESPVVMSGVDLPTGGHVQWEGGHPLARVASSRDLPDEVPVLCVPKSKDTLRRRASKVFRSFTNRESLVFSSGNGDKRLSHSESRTGVTGQVKKRRNTLSNDSRPTHFSIWTKTATAHAIPGTTPDVSATTPPVVEGRRRSSTISHVERVQRPASPPLPPLSAPQEVDVQEAPVVPSADSATNEAVLLLEPSFEITEAASKPTSDATKVEKHRKLQSKRSKNTFSHLFNLKGEKQLRSPPPAKQEDAPVPPVPVIPQELAKAVSDPDTPEISQTPAFASPASVAATPKSSKSRRFMRHRRRATISSMSQSEISAHMAGTPSSMSTAPQVDTPKTPTSLRSRPFSIVDLRKGFGMRSLGKGKGKLFSAKSSPTAGSPPPVPKLPEDSELPATVMQRYKMSRPPPLQSSDSPQQSEGAPVPPSAGSMTSPITVEFGEALEPSGTSLSSPTESEGPVTPMFGAHAGSTPALSMGLGLAPAIELGESKRSEEGVPELSFTPPTSDESEHGTQRASASSAAEDPLFDAFSAPSSLGDLQLQLHEPSTKTSTLDAHLQLDSLRFDDFSFNTNIF